MSPKVLLLALLGGALLAGCGGSGDPASNASATSPAMGSDEQLSRAEFIKRAEAICRQADYEQEHNAIGYRRRHEAELDDLSPGAAEAKVVLAAELPSIRKEAVEIKALGAPPGEEKAVIAFLRAVEAGVKMAEKDPNRMQADVTGTSPFYLADQLGHNYGFVHCENVA